MSLQTLMKEIKKLKPLADEEVPESPRETLAGRLSRQRNAKNDLVSLREDYRRELLTSSIFILVAGSDRDSFIDVATKELNLFTTSPDVAYQEIADKVSPQLYEGKQVNASLIDVLSRFLEDKAREIGIVGYPMIMYKQEYQRQLVDRKDFVAFVKDIVGKEVGTEIVGIQAVTSILDKAIDLGHDANTTPILLPIDDEKDVKTVLTGLQRLTSKVFVVQAGKGGKALKELNPVLVKNIEAEFVLESLKTIRNQIKK